MRLSRFFTDTPLSLGDHELPEAQAHYISPFNAGHGATRSVCDVLLVASGRYAQLLEEFRA